jgi:hypothetical protein
MDDPEKDLLNLKFLDLLPKSGAMYAEEKGCLHLVSIGSLDGFFNQCLFDNADDLIESGF